MREAYRASRRQSVTPEIRAAQEACFERCMTASRREEGRIWLERSECPGVAGNDALLEGDCPSFYVAGLDIKQALVTGSENQVVWNGSRTIPDRKSVLYRNRT